MTPSAAASRRTCALALAVALLATGCATPPPAERNLAQGPWSGRLALRLDGTPPQSFTAAFELKGRAEAGELALRTPLGNTAAQLSWAPGRATLRSGSDLHEFDSLDALAAHATGTPLPVAALFDWLAGVPTQAAGWSADLAELPAGRLQARRTAPAPAADLRLVLDR
ncbi:MAG: outer membrane lipoprotein LolB [Proteobacteria bacterium]|nr:outer membrane lipoprotein LolB [Pseudomonadota bacterium]